MHDRIGMDVASKIFERHGIANQQIKTDLKVISTLGRNLARLLEQTKKLVAQPTGDPDAIIVFTYAPFIQFEELKLKYYKKLRTISRTK